MLLICLRCSSTSLLVLPLLPHEFRRWCPPSLPHEFLPGSTLVSSCAFKLEFSFVSSSICSSYRPCDYSKVFSFSASCCSESIRSFCTLCICCCTVSVNPSYCFICCFVLSTSSFIYLRSPSNCTCLNSAFSAFCSKVPVKIVRFSISSLC